MMTKMYLTNYHNDICKKNNPVETDENVRNPNLKNVFFLFCLYIPLEVKNKSSNLKKMQSKYSVCIDSNVFLFLF